MSKKEKEEKTKPKKFLIDTETEKSVKDVLEKADLESEIVENILLQLNEKYKIKIESFKEDYHVYQQTGRFFTSTKVRQVKRRDYACFINFETDLLLVERIRMSDGVTLQTKTYEYPIALTKTIEIKLNPLINVNRRIILHLCVANISALEISNHIKNLASSVFLRNILKYRDKKLAEKPIIQIVIGCCLLGVVFYFMLIRVFEKAIVRIIGDLTLTPPAT